MSSILKALKKLDDEKRSARQGDSRTPRISLETVARPRHRSRSTWFVLILLLASSAGVAGLWLARDNGEPAPAQERAGTTPLAAPASREAAPLLSSPSVDKPSAASDVLATAAARQPVATDPAGGGSTAVQPSNQAPGKTAVRPTTSQQLTRLPAEQVIEEVRFADEPVPVTSRRQPAPAIKTPVKHAPLVTAPATKLPSISTPVAQAPASKAPVTAMVANRPLLKVSEIFYQAEGGGSMAVVNDLPVMEGTQVDAAMVEAILPDRVRFRVQGSIVEIPLETSR